MSSLFQDLKEGLEEAISFQKGDDEAKTKTYRIMPVKEYSGSEIREIQMNAAMTQSVFASYMGIQENGRGMGRWKNSPNRSCASPA